MKKLDCFLIHIEQNTFVVRLNKRQKQVHKLNKKVSACTGFEISYVIISRFCWLFMNAKTHVVVMHHTHTHEKNNFHISKKLKWEKCLLSKCTWKAHI